ncbi:uncharacterized protein LOC119583261 [Penaeus monodon]|uniref:uncharacterized protein LOC119583261 n=1 Tax=Penaeus monodon TaxID=6687 RepID=UPI0018A7788E|nr:uncharacterized protein LOC119583261 [Penaeus monodon]
MSGKKWTCNIKYVQTRDSGVYECQLSTHPPMGILTNTHGHQPVSHITGGPDMYAQEGIDVTLLCSSENYASRPLLVLYHEFEMINYDSKSKCLVTCSVTRKKKENKNSSIQRVTVPIELPQRKVNCFKSRGESELLPNRCKQQEVLVIYTCVPANARPSSVVLHVITGWFYRRHITLGINY